MAAHCLAARRDVAARRSRGHAPVAERRLAHVDADRTRGARGSGGEDDTAVAAAEVDKHLVDVARRAVRFATSF
jgi:hypothetical protein